MTALKFQVTGFEELQEVFKKLEDDFGPKDQNSILRSAVRQAMRPVLMSSRELVPQDTGALAASLQLESRKPTKRDQRSKYITATDSVVALVTTAPGKKLAQRTFKNKKTGLKQTGIKSDGRANFMEYGFDHFAREVGTAHVAAQPYLRPSLEGNSQLVVDTLGYHLKNQMERYKARQAKKGK